MASYTTFGPGTIELGATGSEVDFSGEVLGGSVGHEYSEVGEARTMLSGDKRGASETRTDSLTFNLENDLTAAGLYQFTITNDGVDVPFTYTPNTTAAATWAGTVTIKLPGTVGADEFGQPLVSDVTWNGVGAFTFTPQPTTPLAQDDVQLTA